MKIRSKLILEIIVSLTLVLGCGFFLSAHLTKTTMEKQVTQRILAVEQEHTTQINDFVDYMQESAAEYAGFMGTVFGDLSLEQYNQMQEKIVESKYFVYGCGIWMAPYVYDDTMEKIFTYVSRAENETKVYNNVTNYNYDYLTQDFYTKVQESGEYYIKEADYDDLTGELLLVFAQPLFDEEGTFLGVLTLEFDMVKLQSFFNQFYTEDFDFFVVDSKGRFISKNSTNFTVKTDNLYEIEAVLNQTQVESIFRNDSGILNIKYNKVNYTLGYETLPELNWKYLYVIPEQINEKHIRNITVAFIVISIIMILILVVYLLMIMKKTITNPLTLLLGEFHNITENNYDTQVEQELLKSRNEFGEIGMELGKMKYSLNEYRKSLKRRTAQLEEEREKLKASIGYTEAVVSALPQKIFISSREGICLGCRGNMELNGHTEDYFIGKHVSDIINVDDTAKLLEAMREVKEPGEVKELELTGIVNGTVEYFNVNISYKDEKELVVVAFRITPLKRQLKEIEYLSTHDQLTGLGNRLQSTVRLKQLIRENAFPISVITCNINGVKTINDTLGRQEGDRLIVRLANILKDLKMSYDNLFRIGGDEFFLILRETDVDKANDFMDKLIKTCAEDCSGETELSVSFGCATMIHKEESMNDIIQTSENMMYKNKLYGSVYRKGSMVEIINSTLLAKNIREQRHSERVSYLCEKAAQSMGMNKYAQNKLKVAGLLHDIGKIGIPESVLDKTEKLTEEEYHNICRHSEIGYKILNSASYMTDISEIIYAHHEKWDGTGYPRKLKGHEIPFESRIIAIADAYDAMTSDRSYRDGLSKEVAIEELIRCKGTQFDPGLVDFFITQVLND